MPVKVEFTPEFKRNLRTLSKEYRHIQDDVEPVIGNCKRGSYLAIRSRASVIPFSRREFSIETSIKAKAGAIA
jgi:mRNA-degrading endonuclease RelE of RelBE toxin-antitoxin system